ncbi:hypothetical protein QFC20_000697 [Naganishia adeliensis]|uniref:Uncharacterized protein n=1 Tax=Naganishia adeliensis TaxID=92952 RepID=A0ACC2WXJ1_9TREE|nr:hypothetical protein QFC20_000697 [Naganishia adeliensis]
MALLADPRASRRFHIALLGALLLFGLSTMVLSVAWLVAARDYYFDVSFVHKSLVLNTVEIPYKGLKNSITVVLVENAIFVALLVLNLAGAVHQSVKLSEQGCFGNTCQFGSATLALAWVSTILLIAFVAFLIIWSVVHESGQRTRSIYLSSQDIKADYVEQESESLLQAGMTGDIAPGSPLTSASHPVTPVVAAASPAATSHPVTPVAVSTSPTATFNPGIPFAAYELTHA